MSSTSGDTTPLEADFAAPAKIARRRRGDALGDSVSGKRRPTMAGYPVPKVPEKLRKAVQGSVDLLKQESSVAAFGVVHRKSKFG